MLVIGNGESPIDLDIDSYNPAQLWAVTQFLEIEKLTQFGVLRQTNGA